MKKIHILTVIFVCFMSIFALGTAFAQDSRPRLGMTVAPLNASPLLLQHLRLAEGEGLMVSNIAVGGELEQSGLSQGDILILIDGHPLSSVDDLQKYVSTLPQNAHVTLDVIQKGEHRQINMVLDNLPDKIVWKYAQPISGVGRNMNGRRAGSLGFNQMIPVQPGNSLGSGAQHMVFKSIISTPDGIKSTSVNIEGAPDDPDSTLSIQIGSDSYKTRIGDIDQLPKEAREVAEQAIAKSSNFSFSFGFGSSGSSLMDEMMKRHQEQMRLMDEFFNQQFMMPVPAVPQQNAPDSNQPDPVLKPIPSTHEIRS